MAGFYGTENFQTELFQRNIKAKSNTSTDNLITVPNCLEAELNTEWPLSQHCSFRASLKNVRVGTRYTNDNYKFTTVGKKLSNVITSVTYLCASLTYSTQLMQDHHGRKETKIIGINLPDQDQYPGPADPDPYKFQPYK
jgi:hypothetical protein